MPGVRVRIPSFIIACLCGDAMPGMNGARTTLPAQTSQGDNLTRRREYQQERGRAHRRETELETE
jgi:hypothetical protein